ncbi:RNA-directed DNA polymerase, eukaryota, reverse transcriptase zinc-binding domain protein [Tanacetum coccineum]
MRAKRITLGWPWLMTGDFSVTLKNEEHSNGGSSISNDMQDFIDCINEAEMKDLCSNGVFYTWIKPPLNPHNNFMKKLDRAIVNEDLILRYPDANAMFLPYLVSDHNPVVVRFPYSFKKKKKAFRFANFINDKDGFLPTVANGWEIEVQGNDLKKAQTNLDNHPHNQDIKEKEVNALKNYNEAANDEESFLFQKAKVDWICKGDRNNQFFHKIIKSRRQVNKIISICDDAGNRLEGVFGTKLNHEEAMDMIKEVTDSEIKNALFDIGDNKAPGPDGYTSTFFKKAWKIIGNDVCMAIKEFFNTGKLLREMNATIISLIPKISTLNKVPDYRPIACCNVIYMCISKILTKRLKPGLHKKGYFPSGRGLRQGDHMSPCLLTLVMEVFTLLMAKNVQHNPKFKFHTRCKELRLTHLCFADDLLVVCNGDVESVKVIKTTMMEFSGISGLIPNMEKINVFFGNVKNEERNKILIVLPFAVGKLSVKYLGVPLITKRLQLIASVLSFLNVYWATVFMIPKAVVKDIDKILKGFLWCKGDIKRGKAKVAWKNVCSPKSQGGLGLRPFGIWNEVLLIKNLWNITAGKNTLWVKWVNVVKLKGRSIWNIQKESNDSWMWKTLLDLRGKIRLNVMKILGDGKSTNVWFDHWSSVGILSDIVNSKDIYDARLKSNMSVWEVIKDNKWKWSDEWAS